MPSILFLYQLTASTQLSRIFPGIPQRRILYFSLNQSIMIFYNQTYYCMFFTNKHTPLYCRSRADLYTMVPNSKRPSRLSRGWNALRTLSRFVIPKAHAHTPLASRDHWNDQHLVLVRYFMAGTAIKLVSCLAKSTVTFRQQLGTWVDKDRAWFLFPWKWAELLGSHLCDLGSLIESHLRHPW